MQDYNVYLQMLLQLTPQIRDEVINRDCSDYDKTPDEIETDFNTLLEDEFRSRIAVMMSCESLLKQKRIKASLTEWMLKFVTDKKDIEQLIHVYSVEQQEIKLYTLADLLNLRKDKATQWIFKGLLKFGQLIMVVASPKVGKTNLATHAAVAVARGTPFLNRESTAGNVLFIENEEPIDGTTINRIYDHGLQLLELEEPELYKELINSEKLIVTRNVDIVLDQTKILEIVKEKNINLIIIDTLAASLKVSGYTEYSPEVPSALYKLQSLAQEHGFSILLLHHNTKMANSNNRTGMMNGVAGSSALTRANDGIWSMFAADDGTVNVHTIPRDGEPIKLSLVFEKDEACYWYFKVLKESVLSVENIELQNQILRLLYERWEQWRDEVDVEDIEVKVYGLTLNDIVELTSASRNDVVKRLNDMTSTEGIIRYVGNNRAFIYAIDSSGESWMTVYLEAEEERKYKAEEKERVAALYQNELEVIKVKLVAAIDDGVDAVRELVKSLTITERKDVQAKLTNDERNKLVLLLNPCEFKVGDTVQVIEEPAIINRVVNIEFRKVDKENSYHMITLDNMPDRTFKAEHLNLYERESKSNHDSDLL